MFVDLNNDRQAMQHFEHQWQQLRDYHASNGVICPKHFARAAQSFCLFL